MTTERRERCVPWLALGAAALAWLLSSLPAAVQAKYALTHGAWTSGEPWRLWTGHFVHFGAAHLRGNLLAFVVWAALLEQTSRRTLARILLLGSPLLSVAILTSQSSLGEYRGLSGLDCSLVAALIWQRGLATARFRWLGAACLLAFFAKCGYELYAGRAILAPDLGEGVRLLPLAHVVGAALGAAMAAKARRQLALRRGTETLQYFPVKRRN